MLTNFTLNKIQSIYNNKTILNEYIDDRLNSLIQNNIGIEFGDNHYQRIHHGFANEQAHLNTLFSKYNKKDKCLKIKIKLPEHSWGRILPEDHASLSVLHRPTRHSLCDNTYVDIDIISCCQSVFQNVLSLNGDLSYIYLKKYLDNRDEIFNRLQIKYNVSRDNIKKLFTALAFGSSVNTWYKDNNIQNDYDNDVVGLQNEYHKLMEIIYDANPKICDDILKKNPHYFIKYNTPESLLSKKKRTTMALFYQTVERYIQEECINYLVKNKDFKLKDIVPCQDGFMILKNLYYNDIVIDCQQVIKQTFNFDIKFKVKEFDEKFYIPPYINDKDLIKLKKEEERKKKEEEKKAKEEEKQRKKQIIQNSNDLLQLQKEEELRLKQEEKDKHLQGKIFAESDKHAAEIVLSYLGKNVFYWKGKTFLKNDNIWSCDKLFVDNSIYNFIINLDIHKLSNYFPIPYSANSKSAKAIQEVFNSIIITSTEDKILYHKFHTTTKNKLCFKDGVLDFKDKKFYTWDEIDFEYYTCIQIKRNFKDYFENPNRDIINEIKNKLIDGMYADKSDIALQFFSRAITGNYEDKNFLTYLGNRDCGKGVQYNLLETAFGDYVRTYELGNVLYNSKTAGSENVDCSKKLYWLLDLEFVRLAISQEVPDSKSGLVVNSKIWKKANGGGDTIVARRNFDRCDTHFTIETTFANFGNYSLMFDSDDCCEHELNFCSVNQFKTEEEIEQLRNNGISDIELSRYKIKDLNLKNKCKTEEWANAMVYLLYENFIDKPVTIIREIYEDESINLIGKITMKYSITNNIEDDFIVANDLYKLINDDKKKIDNELKSINVFKKKNKKRGEYRDKMCFFGLKLINNDYETDEE